MLFTAGGYAKCEAKPSILAEYPQGLEPYTRLLSDPNGAIAQARLPQEAIGFPAYPDSLIVI